MKLCKPLTIRVLTPSIDESKMQLVHSNWYGFY